MEQRIMTDPNFLHAGQQIALYALVMLLTDIHL